MINVNSILINKSGWVGIKQLYTVKEQSPASARIPGKDNKEAICHFANK